MGVVIDIIILVIIVGTMIFAVKNGFAKTALGTLGFFIAAAVAVCFCSPLGNLFAESRFGEKIEAVVDNTVDNIVTPENYEGIFENGDEDDEKSALEVLFTSFGASDAYNAISEGYEEQRNNGLEIAKDYIKNGVKDYAVPFCCDMLAFLLLYFGMRLIIKIAEIVVGKLTKLPVLKQADKTLGAVLGVLLSVFRVSLFCVALKVIVPVSGALGIDFIARIDLTSSVLYRLFGGGGLLSALI